jgi:rare lipoprotein A
MVVPKGKYKPFKKDAHASYYADKFTGRKCASGRIFDNNKYYAAHKSLPFGTKLKVTNERNGKIVYVEVVDRGPFVKGRELDLSHRAFRDINPARGSGAVIVTIEILQK